MACQILAVFVIIAALIAPSVEFSTGAPDFMEGVCSTQFPSGHGAPAQSDDFPVFVEVDTTSGTSETVKVSLQPVLIDEYKGLLLTLRDSSGNLVGKPVVPTGFQANCGGNGITHSSSDDKGDITITFTDASNAASLRLTIVQEREVFWIYDRLITRTEDSTTTSTTTTTTTTAPPPTEAETQPPSTTTPKPTTTTPKPTTTTPKPTTTPTTTTTPKPTTTTTSTTTTTETTTKSTTTTTLKPSTDKSTTTPKPTTTTLTMTTTGLKSTKKSTTTTTSTPKPTTTTATTTTPPKTTTEKATTTTTAPKSTTTTSVEPSTTTVALAGGSGSQTGEPMVVTVKPTPAIKKPTTVKKIIEKTIAPKTSGKEGAEADIVVRPGKYDGEIGPVTTGDGYCSQTGNRLEIVPGTDCTEFYMDFFTTYRRRVTQKCPSGLQLNVNTCVCDYPSNVDCQN